MDRAWIYGNEAEVGEGLLKSGVPREEVFLTGKLWNASARVLPRAETRRRGGEVPRRGCWRAA